MVVAEAQEALVRILRGGDPDVRHVTQLAAASLRAVDARHLQLIMSEPSSWRTFRDLRNQLVGVLRVLNDPKRVSSEEKRRLGSLAGLVRVDANTSFSARALAQALHEACGAHFWSYFAAWKEPRQVKPGDPFPVPTATRLEQIYPAQQFKLSPAPDSRDAAKELPGGYRGLPSLRLMPELEGEVLLDPSLDRRFCPLTRGEARGKVAVVVPYAYLLEGYEFESQQLEGGDRIFFDVRPRDVSALVARAMGHLDTAASSAALALMPELTGDATLDREVERTMAGGGLGELQLVVTGSSWAKVQDGDLGCNRATAFPRGRAPHVHDKFSWYRDNSAGREALAARPKRITVLAGPHITYAVMICKDVLESWVPAAIQQLRVRLVVVVSCNAGLGAYVPTAASMSDLGWSTVIIANAPAMADEPREYGRGFRPAAPRVSATTPGAVTSVGPDRDGHPGLLTIDILGVR